MIRGEVRSVQNLLQIHKVMTEEEKKKIGEWINSPEAGPVLAHEVMSMHGGRLYFQTPESNGFPANRFSGRLLGFMYALAQESCVSLNQLLAIIVQTCETLKPDTLRV